MILHSFRSEISYFPSSNKAELLTVISALIVLPINSEVTIYTDSNNICESRAIEINNIIQETKEFFKGAYNSLLINADKDPIINDELVNKMTFWDRTYSETKITFIDLIKGRVANGHNSHKYLGFADGIGIWDWDLGLEFGIGIWDWDLKLGFGIGIWDGIWDINLAPRTSSISNFP
ncbi:hypothetical protein RhiirB3_531549 [Rhizophagus irregularis]|nr:hypothetical protein RhiirB3_531549 [Rhizophagus irregularis]